MDPSLEYCRRNFKYVVPLPPINQVQTICKILEGILPKVRMGARGRVLGGKGKGGSCFEGENMMHEVRMGALGAWGFVQGL